MLANFRMFRVGAESARTWNIIRCIISAVILTASVYPDVIFNNAGLSTANVLNVTLSQIGQRAPIFPERKGRDVTHGYYDIGGSGYQSEPAVQFMARALRNGQSVYWNPYSATGSFGIETLVDIKTSPVTMLVALLAGSSAAFHTVYLAFAAIGVFCLLMLLTVEFRLSFLAALGGGVSFLLNGYFVANSASNVSQVWLYFPVLTLGLVSFSPFAAHHGVPARCVRRGADIIHNLSSDDVDGYGNDHAGWHVRCRGLREIRSKSRRQTLRRFAAIVCGQAAAITLALAALAVVYLPVVEAMDYMHTGEFM